jgi:DUF1680 family protein
MLAHTLAAMATILTAATNPGDHADPKPLRAVPFSSVQLTGGLLAQRQAANATGTLEQNLHQCEITGRLDNFAKAAPGAPKGGKHEGYFFNDSDVYKAVEGASDILAQTHDPALDQRLDQIIQLIAKAQQPDGYLYTYYQLGEQGGTDSRWTNLKDMHELYCAGHLIEAAVAHNRATGKRSLLDVATRLADHIDSVFGPHEGARKGVCGHEEIELALIKLADLTGDQKYFRLAQHFIDLRGDSTQRETFGEYCQDQVPVREQDHVVGHAVRAMYLYSAVADLAMRTGDQGFIDAMERVWDDLTTRKMYITGGIGPSASNEGFTTAYDLPNDTAYAETCAAIGLVFWSHRLTLLHADAKYADVMERALYNGVMSGVSLDGRRFFYVNPLASRGNHHRQDWFACACCPPNFLRLIATLGGYMYAQSEAGDAIYVNLYSAGTADLKIKNLRVRLTQETDYPWQGLVRLTVEPNGPVHQSDPIEICLRVPGWVDNPSEVTVAINGDRLKAEPERGYLHLRRAWKPGDVIELNLPMPIERIAAHPEVKANQGRIALQRGPIVYCLESADNDDRALEGHVRALILPPEAPISADFRKDLLGGVVTLRGRAFCTGPADADWNHRLYRPARARPVEFTAIPYFAWDNRDGGAGEMLVWLPESESLAERPLDPTIKPTASHCFQGDTLAGLYDRLEPTSSADGSIPRFTWWPRKGDGRPDEWVQYDFTSPRRVSTVDVYWFDDSAAGGGCKVPASWRVLYRLGDDWLEAKSAHPGGIKPDTFNRVSFRPIETTGLRLEVKLQDGASSGILEWRVE